VGDFGRTTAEYRKIYGITPKPPTVA